MKTLGIFVKDWKNIALKNLKKSGKNIFSIIMFHLTPSNHNYSHSLRKNLITSKGASILFDTLSKLNIEVSDINLNGNEIDDTCLENLGNLLRLNTSIRNIYIGGDMNVGYDIEANPNGMITDEGVDILASQIIGNVTLEILGLSCHLRITSASLDNLKEIANKTKMKKILLFGTSISTDDVHQLHKFLKIDPEERQIPIFSSSKSASKAQR